MIDPHIHILPRVDDGAKSPEVSLTMLNNFASLGFKTLIATPHVSDLPTPEYLERINAGFAAIEESARSLGIEIVAGFENLLSPRTASLLESGAPLTLGSSKAVLVEVSLAGWPAFADQVLFDMQLAGFTPILAHPERYSAIIADPDKGVELARRGVLLQGTTAAFCGLFGRDIQRTAEALLLDDAIHVLGSDAHSAGQRTELIARGLARVEELVGSERLKQLTTDNVAALLADNPLPIPAEVVSAPKRRWSLLGRSH